MAIRRPRTIWHATIVQSIRWFHNEGRVPNKFTSAQHQNLPQENRPWEPRKCVLRKHDYDWLQRCCDLQSVLLNTKRPSSRLVQNVGVGVDWELSPAIETVYKDICSSQGTENVLHTSQHAKAPNKFEEVESIDDRTAINTFHNSLRPGKLYESFFTDLPSTYQETMIRALNHARAEEVYRARREEAGMNIRRDKRPDTRHDDRGKGRSFDRQVPNFAKLNRPVSKVVKYLDESIFVLVLLKFC